MENRYSNYYISSMIYICYYFIIKPKYCDMLSNLSFYVEFT